MSFGVLLFGEASWKASEVAIGLTSKKLSADASKHDTALVGKTLFLWLSAERKCLADIG
jgi:hypothetical protein